MAVFGGRTSTRASYAVSWYSGMALVCVIAVPLSMLWDEYAPLMMMAFMPVPIFFLTVLCVVARARPIGPGHDSGRCRIPGVAGARHLLSRTIHLALDARGVR